MKYNEKDVNVSPWGPFSREGVGLCHAAADGTMLSIHPLCGFSGCAHKFPSTRQYREDLDLLSALPDLSYYAIRQFLRRDKSVFADIEFHTITDDSATIVVKYSNHSKEPVNVDTFLVCSLANAPDQAGHWGDDAGLLVLPARNYVMIQAQLCRWLRDLPFGIVRDSAACDGTAFSFDLYEGRDITWRTPDNLGERCFLRLRYAISESGQAVTFHHCEGRETLALEDTSGEYVFSNAIRIPLCPGKPLVLSRNSELITLKLDSLFFCSNDEEPKPPARETRDVLEVACNGPNRVEIKTKGERSYCISSDQLAAEQEFGPYRRLMGLDKDDLLRACDNLTMINMVPPDQRKPARHLSIGSEYHLLAPSQTYRQQFLISAKQGKGAFREVPAKGRIKTINIVQQNIERQAAYARRFVGPFQKLIRGLAVQTLLNINFPEKLQDLPVRFYTPAKHYSTLYLWDMGMTGIGLASLSRSHALDLLNQYLTPAASSVPFVAWGTMLPIHIVLFWQLCQEGPDREMLKRYFPPILRMYDFFAGHDSASRLRDPETGLIHNFFYFYNSGGWDDYPAQQIANQHREREIFPVICLSQTILCAKLLRVVCRILGETRTEARLEGDIEDMEAALYRHHWNPREKHFSYYDKTNDEFLKIDGCDANMGLDAYYPMIANATDAKTTELFIERLSDPETFMTSFGLTTVSRSAPYFREDGYWNGHVWAPHNWFYWKSMLTHGYASQAREVAMRLLKGYADSSRQTGCIFECLHHRLGTPEHAPYFSGLTAPMLDMHSAYFSPGRVTCGFEMIATLKREAKAHVLDVFSPFYRGPSTFLINLEPHTTYVIRDENMQESIMETDEWGNREYTINIASDNTRITLVG